VVVYEWMMGKREDRDGKRAQLHERGPVQILGAVLPVWLSGCLGLGVAGWQGRDADEDGETGSPMGSSKLLCGRPDARVQCARTGHGQTAKAQVAGASELSVYMVWRTACLSPTNAV